MAAAEAIEPHLNKLERMVMDYLAKAKDGGTDEEVALGTGLRQETARARRRELVIMGKVIKSDKQRPTSSGRAATVWILKRIPHGGTTPP